MRTNWKIVPIRSSGPIGYKWRWIKKTDRKIIEVSAEPFDYYYDCLADARKHGYYAVETKNLINNHSVR